jgi:hypothetical protein
MACHSFKTFRSVAAPQAQQLHALRALFKDFLSLPTVTFCLNGPVIFPAEAPAQLLAAASLAINPSADAHRNERAQ